MMLQFFDSLESSLKAKILEMPGTPNPRKKLALEIARLGKRLYTGHDRVAWCGILTPFDVLNAMGVTSCFVEFVGGMLASTGTVSPFLEEAEHAGFAADACGYHRSVMGAARKGTMPVPDFMIATTCPCSGGIAVLENLAGSFDRDLLVLHVPQDESTEAVNHLANQFKDMVEFISAHTGVSLDEQRLRRSIENSNTTSDLMNESYKLAQNVPSPVAGRDLRNFGILMPLFFGTDAAIELAQAFRDEFAARIDTETAGVPGEKLRLMWIQNRIQFKNPVEKMLESEYQAAIVIDELNSITWESVDPDDPYPGLARRAISNPLNGSIERRVDHLKNLAQAYRIDGAINPCNWGCRQGTGSRGLIEDGLREINVPVLNLEVDCVDQRNFAEGQIRTRLEAFMEMLYGRPSTWH
jgi:benzoyl-CoA reductase/2-hydroxyglutaryl-CoA dehydratase subunit BcrC/BadD/HgdB